MVVFNTFIEQVYKKIVLRKKKSKKFFGI